MRQKIHFGMHYSVITHAQPGFFLIAQGLSECITHYKN